MFGRKKDMEKILLDNFDKYIVLASYKNSEKAITAVKGDIFALSMFFKELFTESKEIRDIAEASIDALKLMERLNKEAKKEENEKPKKEEKEKTQPKKGKK